MRDRSAGRVGQRSAGRAADRSVGRGGARPRAGRIETDAYLARLGVTAEAPSLAALKRLQRAHVTRVPYETFWLLLGDPAPIDVESSVARIVSGWGGYCFHLNGAFHWLLTELGYDSRLHRGGVHGGRQEVAPGATGDHAVITVHLNGATWVVDVGLGNCVIGPIPLRENAISDPLLDLRLRPSDVVQGGWRVEQDSRLKSYRGMDFVLDEVELDAFGPNHVALSTDPDSPFVQLVSAHRRTVDEVHLLKGAGYRRFDRDGLHERMIESSEEWWTTVAEAFGLPVDRVRADVRKALWDNVIGRPVVR